MAGGIFGAPRGLFSSRCMDFLVVGHRELEPVGLVAPWPVGS